MCTTCRCCSSSVRNKRGAEGLALGLAGQATRTFHRARRFTTVSTSSSSAASVPPFPTAQFVISKKKLYDFRVNWSQSYYSWNQNDNVIWRRTANLLELQISATLPVTTGGVASPQLIDARGNIVQSAQSPKAQAAFRYYRFASSSGDLFEAYRYMYLCLESALDDLDPSAKLVQKKGGMRKRAERMAC